MSKTMVWSFSVLMFNALNASGTPLSKIWKSDTWALSGWLIGLFNVKAIWLAFSVRAVKYAMSTSSAGMPVNVKSKLPTLNPDWSAWKRTVCTPSISNTSSMVKVDQLLVPPVVCTLIDEVTWTPSTFKWKIPFEPSAATRTSMSYKPEVATSTV